MIDYIRLRLIRRPGADAMSLYADNKRRTQITEAGHVTTSKDIAARAPSGVRYCHRDTARHHSFTVEGSPIKLTTGGPNVFAEGPSADHDLVGCAWQLLGHMPDLNDEPFADRYPLDKWELRRIDITENLIYPTPRLARQALKRLKTTPLLGNLPARVNANSARWRPSSGDTSLLVYGKGREAKQHNRLAAADETLTRYTEHQLHVAHHLVRLEANLMGDWCEAHGFNVTADTLTQTWKETTTPMTRHETFIAEREQVRELLHRTYANRKAMTLFATWRLIAAEGYEIARQAGDRTTFYRHVRDLKAAGINDLATWAGHHRRLGDHDAPPPVGRLVTTWEEAEAFLAEHNT